MGRPGGSIAIVLARNNGLEWDRSDGKKYYKRERE